MLNKKMKGGRNVMVWFQIFVILAFNALSMIVSCQELFC